MIDQTIKASDKWIPWYFVLFFVVIAILDGIFVYVATSTHTGTVTDNAYDKGLRYNELIEAKEEQVALGWQSELDYNDADKSVSFLLQDRDGNPITGANVTVHAMHVAADGNDFQQRLSTSGQGRYNTQLHFPVNGRWDLRIVAIWNKQHYQIHQRVLVN